MIKITPFGGFVQLENRNVRGDDAGGVEGAARATLVASIFAEIPASQPGKRMTKTCVMHAEYL